MWCFYYECLTAQNAQHTVNASNISLCVLCIEISIRLRVPTGGIPGESKSIAGGPWGMSSKPPAQEQIKSKMEFLICLLCLFFCSASAKVLTAVPVLSSAPGHLMLQSAFQNFLLGIIFVCFIFSSKKRLLASVADKYRSICSFSECSFIDELNVFISEI